MTDILLENDSDKGSSTLTTCSGEIPMTELSNRKELDIVSNVAKGELKERTLK